MTPPRAKAESTSTVHPPAGATTPTDSTEPAPARAIAHSTSKEHPPARVDLDTIKALGGLLDDLELVRVMNGNRIGALEREHGEALPHLLDIQDRVAAIEHLAHLELVRAWRKYPVLALWGKGYIGVGEKSIARLVAIIGDPAERPNVAKLWAYCGHGDAARKRAKGMSQDELFRLGNPRAKKQVHLIAEALMNRMCASCRREKDARRIALGLRANQSPPWAPPPADCSCESDGLTGRVVYDETRAKYADALHESPCPQCGPAGKPALPGSPLSDGHKHARALRKVGKDFLRDLWIASRHDRNDDHSLAAGGDS